MNDEAARHGRPATNRSPGAEASSTLGARLDEIERRVYLLETADRRKARRADDARRDREHAAVVQVDRAFKTRSRA
jgi:hypothetical protein